jgi:hypothetical protein
MSSVLEHSTPTVSSTEVVDPEYWLEHCEGFRVVGPDGVIGTVRHVKPPWVDHDSVLIARTGLFRERHVRIPAADVDHIEPWREMVVVRRAPTRT